MKAQKSSLLVFVLGIAALAPLSAAAEPVVGPTALRVDNLTRPLGIDDQAPHFSWQLADPARGARQTAYRVQVASQAELLGASKPDVWDSGKVHRDESLNVAYKGPALKPSTRYWWRVTVWNGEKAYAVSDISWWETALLTENGWRGEWIGYETPEEAAVRGAASTWIASPDAKAVNAEKSTEQHFAYRTTVKVAGPVRKAVLFATGQDAVSAWIDGAQVMTADKLPPWQQTPWRKFVRADVTDKLKAGANTIAVEAVHYVVDPNGMATADAPPMIATLVVEYADGKWATFGSAPGWKVATHAAAGWEQPLFDASRWKAAVKFAPEPGSTADPLLSPVIPDSVKALRHEFTVSAPVKSARVYATALGAYELFVNGQRVANDVMDPGWTDFRQRVKYQTYDVTDLVKKGSNAIGALLAPGWYETSLEWFQQPNNYGNTPPALRAQLRIEHTDGSVEWVTAGTDWQAHTSSIVSAEIYDGEKQDARLKELGWNAAGFKGGGWTHAAAIKPAAVKIEAQDYPSIRVEQRIDAKTLTEPKPGVYIFDFGQNLSGVELLHAQAPAGTTVRLRFGEVLNADGTLYTDNLRTAKATDEYTFSGKADEISDSGNFEVFEPQFTFHGFRYAEVTGLTTPPKKESLAAMVFHTDAPFTAQLETGSAMVNKLWSNILWGQRSNFVGIPTDCPQRDERLGWMADAQVFWRAASYNMDLAAFSRQFAQDMRGTQTGTPYYGIFSPGTVTESAQSGAGWSDAGVVIPWTTWLQTGDTSVIDQNWTAMERYLNAIDAHNPDGLWKNEAGIHFGDWLSPEGKTDYTLIATAYWAYDVTLMRQMAHATGRNEDEARYARQFEKIRSAFEKQFVHEDGFVAGADNNEPSFGAINNPGLKVQGGDTQTGYVLALHMNLLPEDLRAAAAERLVKKIEANHGMLGTGFLGTPYLLEELTKAGHADLAFHLLLNTTYPSWGYMVEHGATTMWERWNGDQMRGDPSMNSYNHYAYGAVADWIYRYAAGVDATPLDAGFHTVVLHPVFDARLGKIAFDYQSAYGPIHSDWKVDGATAEWHVTLPANTTGWLPLSADQAANYKIDGTALADSKVVTASNRAGASGFELAPGSYSFAVRLER